MSNQCGEDALQCGHAGLNTPFERFFQHALAPFEEFIRDESAGGILLMLCSVAALIMANTSLFAAYDNILHTKISIGFTMSIFVAGLAFEGRVDYLVKAKIAIILASVIAGAGGFIWLYVAGRKGVD